jgi:hypothetical protein
MDESYTIKQEAEMTNQGRHASPCDVVELLREERIVGVARHSDRSRQLTPIDDRHSVPPVLTAHNALRVGDGGR